jgi:hypothetical protein
MSMPRDMDSHNISKAPLIGCTASIPELLLLVAGLRGCATWKYLDQQIMPLINDSNGLDDLTAQNTKETANERRSQAVSSSDNASLRCVARSFRWTNFRAQALEESFFSPPIHKRMSPSPDPDKTREMARELACWARQTHALDRIAAAQNPD